MKKLLFVALLGFLFLAGCNSQHKSKEIPSVESTKPAQVADIDTSEEVEGAIDDSGEILADSTDEIESE